MFRPGSSPPWRDSGLGLSHTPPNRSLGPELGCLPIPGVFISLLYVDPNAQAPPSPEALLPHRPAPRWKGKERTFLAAGGARDMTGRAEASDSIKQTCLTLRTWAPGETQPRQKGILVPPVPIAQFLPTSPSGKKWVFHQGHCARVLYTDPALSCHFL